MAELAAEIPAASVPEGAWLLDVREDDEWVAGHAPEAVFIPMGDLPSQMEELPIGDEPLAIVCRSGNRSGRVVAWLAQQGIDAVNVAGGMRAWDAAGKPMVAEGSGPARVI